MSVYGNINDDGFFDASTARSISTGGSSASSVILKEINALQEAVQTATTGSVLRVAVTTSTMSSSTDYYNAWANTASFVTDADKMMRLRMDRVISYFSRRGYVIKRVRIAPTNFFQWDISW